jgi:hypothetical protein
MTIKYFGTSYEKGLNLKVNIFDSDGSIVVPDLSMTETGTNTAVYKTDNYVGALDPGLYVARVENVTDGTYLGFEDIIFNGMRQVTLLELKFLTEVELMQLRDAVGIDGDKMVARGGQLQNKSEAPYNDLVNSVKPINK